MIEAHYTGLPLIALTADRPRRYRGTGAPQAIEQKDLFSPYARVSLDWEAEGEWSDAPMWNAEGPAHLNVCFEEPLPGIDPLRLERPASDETPSLTGLADSVYTLAAGCLDDFLASTERPIAVVGPLPENERPAVLRFLRELGLPVLAEASSGLREEPALANQRFLSGERILTSRSTQGLFDGILRLGGVPVSRLWRDLDGSQKNRRALSLGTLPFSGSSRIPLVHVPLRPFLPRYRVTRPFSRERYGSLYDQDQKASVGLEEILSKEPLSEPGMMRDLSSRLSPSSLVYLGNSLPVREWEMAATRRSRFRIHSSRGANGINGQVSTFFGLAEFSPSSWALLARSHDTLRPERAVDPFPDPSGTSQPRGGQQPGRPNFRKDVYGSLFSKSA